jgi:RES domain-containing protein
MVYASGSISLCTLEMLVHLHDPRILTGYMLFQVELDARLIVPLDRARLPRNWRSFPAPQDLAALGDEWIRSRRSVALEVPSAVIESESNYLLNPAHLDFATLQIHNPVPHDFDGRLVSS